jgi:hypothetical protein
MTDNNSTKSDQSPPENGRQITSQQVFLIGLLGIVLVIVLVISILILTRSEAAPVPSPTDQMEVSLSTDVPPTLTITPSITPSLRATFTLKPTRTPTSGPTSTGTPQPTLIPSLTPAFPSEHNDQYILVPWTPELADQLIVLLEEYPESLSSFARGEDDQGYYDAFQYALFAQEESLLRFPTAPQADGWSRQMAYNLARTGDPSAGEIYADLITQDLNSGKINIDELPFWGLDHEPFVIVEVIPLISDSDDLSNSLVKVSADENGSSYFWLIEEQNRYVSHPLTSDFNFVQPSDVDHFTFELPGISRTVVGIFPIRVYDSVFYEHPDVFALLQEPPVGLDFTINFPPAIGPDFVNNWEPIEPAQPNGDLQFLDVIFPTCPVTVTHTYKWNHSSFSFQNDSYQINPDPDLLGYCEIVVNHSALVWGMEPTIQLMETLLPIWPPELTSTGAEYPDDALDEWRYRLSLYYGIIANQDEARGYAELIVTEPASPNSNWITPAADFLETYQEQRDIYTACLPSTFCDPRLAFQSLVRTITPSEYSDLKNALEEAGVTVRSHGFFDFDNDGETEPWFVIRHQTGSPLEFWIISPTDSEFEAVFVSEVETENARLSYIEPVTEPPTVLLEPDITFIFKKDGSGQNPVVVMVEVEVVFSSDRTEAELDELEAFLLAGGDPEFVRTELIVLGNSPHFTCSFLLCPRYLYLLGLASELVNDEFSAVAAYLELWREFPGSPFTTIARFKLGSIFTPTPTSTAKPSDTPTPPSTQDVPTDTPEGYPAPTLVPTNTQPGYPAPTDTPTSTQPGYPAPSDTPTSTQSGYPTP